MITQHNQKWIQWNVLEKSLKQLGVRVDTVLSMDRDFEESDVTQNLEDVLQRASQQSRGNLLSVIF